VTPTDNAGNSAIDWCQVVATNRAPQNTMKKPTNATNPSENGSMTRRNGGDSTRTNTETLICVSAR
jgi:hypothetical protein